MRTRRSLNGLGLNTVCESARCPNLGECYACGNATFLILGEQCTRDCAFCAVDHGSPLPPDPLEGQRIADYVRSNGIRYAVLTSGDPGRPGRRRRRPFFSSGKGSQSLVPPLQIELLVPDFGGRRGAIETVAGIAHPGVRPQHRNRAGAVSEGAPRRGLPALPRSVEDRGAEAKPETIFRADRGAAAAHQKRDHGRSGETEEQLQRLFSDLAAVQVEICNYRTIFTTE